MATHKVNSVDGELSEYVFDFGGVLALRNFTARTNGNRLIIHSNENANFTILDALVDEVEINGVVYDNPAAAQEALQRLVFNPAVPVIMTEEERKIIQNFKNYLGKGLLSDTVITLEPNKSVQYVLPQNSKLFAIELKADCLLKIGRENGADDLGEIDSKGVLELGFLDGEIWLTSDKEVGLTPIIYRF